MFEQHTAGLVVPTRAFVMPRSYWESESLENECYRSDASMPFMHRAVLSLRTGEAKWTGHGVRFGSVGWQAPRLRSYVPDNRKGGR